MIERASPITMHINYTAMLLNCQLIGLAHYAWTCGCPVSYRSCFLACCHSTTLGARCNLCLGIAPTISMWFLELSLGCLWVAWIFVASGSCKWIVMRQVNLSERCKAPKRIAKWNHNDKLLINRSSIINGSWIMAHGSWLKLHGSCLNVHGSRLLADKGAQGPTNVRNPRWSLGPGPSLAPPPWQLDYFPVVRNNFWRAHSQSILRLRPFDERMKDHHSGKS